MHGPRAVEIPRLVAGTLPPLPPAGEGRGEGVYVKALTRLALRARHPLPCRERGESPRSVAGTLPPLPPAGEGRGEGVYVRPRSPLTAPPLPPPARSRRRARS